jgi:hypothetical protein
MADYTVKDIIDAMIVQCPKCTHAQIMTGVAVSLAENTGRKLTARNHNTNGTDDVGPWQINDVHHVPDSCRTSLVCSTHQAFIISGGFKNWTPWSTYKNGAYKAHLGDAEKGTSGDNTQGAGILGTGVGPDIAPGASEAVSSLPAAVGQIANTLEHLVSGLFSSSLWFRVGKVVVGLFLGAAGLIILIRKAGITPPVIPIPV